MNTIWITIETAPFSGRWVAEGSDITGIIQRDNQVFDTKEECLAHCEELNRLEEVQ